MTKEQLIEECLKTGDSYLDYPFDATTAVIKIKANGKMFAFLDYAVAEKVKRNCGEDTPVLDGDLIISLKCNPSLSDILREKYTAVVPGYYCNKVHWNSVIVGKDVSIDELRKMIEHSYRLIISKK